MPGHEVKLRLIIPSWRCTLIRFFGAYPRQPPQQGYHQSRTDNNSDNDKSSIVTPRPRTRRMQPEKFKRRPCHMMVVKTTWKEHTATPMRSPNMALIQRDDRHNNWCEYHIASWISSARYRVGLMNSAAGWRCSKTRPRWPEPEGQLLPGAHPLLFMEWHSQPECRSSDGMMHELAPQSLMRPGR